MSLLDDLRDTPSGGVRDYGCSACDAIRSCPEGETREELIQALAGRLSERRMLALSKRHGLGIGRAGIIKHRREDHRP